MTGILLCTIVFIFTILMHIYFKRKNKEIEKMFPAPLRLPIFGNLLIFFRTTESIYEYHLQMCDYFKHKPFIMWFFYKPYVIVSDYKTAKIILSSHELIDKADEYEIFVPWVGRQLFVGNGETWRRFRKHAVPAFHFKILNQFLGTFSKNADLLCKQLSIHDGRGAFDIYKYLTTHTLDNICETAMGVDMQAQITRTTDIHQSIRNMITVIYLRCIIPILRIDWLFKISPLNHLQEKSLEILRGVSAEVIRIRKKLKMNGHKKIEDDDLNMKEKKTFLELLLDDQLGKFTDEEIQREVDHLLFAGHDSTASALSFTLYCLAQHPEVQELVYQELTTIFEKSNRCPNYNDLQNMKYTEQVIKETLRLYTTISVIGRKVPKDVYINEKQYIPKGTNVGILLSAIHRDPEVWPDPDVFNPDRFSEELTQNRDLFAFVPFSAGPRNCLGQKFAMFEMKITVSKIIRNFKLYISDNPRDEARPKAKMVLTSANGIRIKLKSRNNTTAQT